MIIEGHNRQKPKINKVTEVVSKSMEPVAKSKKIANKPQVNVPEVRAKQSDSDYDNDEFEREDIVKMADPVAYAPTAATKARKLNLAER